MINLGYVKGPSIKDVCSQGEFVQCGQVEREGGFFRCGRPHFLVQKTSAFPKFMVCHTDKGGERVKPVRTFFGQREERGLSQCGHISYKGGGRVNFCNFVQTSFTDGP